MHVKVIFQFNASLCNQGRSPRWGLSPIEHAAEPNKLVSMMASPYMAFESIWMSAGTRLLKQSNALATVDAGAARDVAIILMILHQVIHPSLSSMLMIDCRAICVGSVHAPMPLLIWFVLISLCWQSDHVLQLLSYAHSQQVWWVVTLIVKIAGCGFWPVCDPTVFHVGEAHPYPPQAALDQTAIPHSCRPPHLVHVRPLYILCSVIIVFLY